MPINKKKYKSRCHDLYVHSGWETKAIAELFGLSDATVIRWAREADWDKERVVVETSPFVMAYNLKKEIYDIIHQKNLLGARFEKGELDGLSKLMSIAEKIEKKVNVLGHALIIMRDVAEWMKKFNPDLAKQFGSAFPSLMDYIWAKYSQ
jgi:transposase